MIGLNFGQPLFENYLVEIGSEGIYMTKLDRKVLHDEIRPFQIFAPRPALTKSKCACS